MPALLQDGNPLTYDWLNLLAKEVNSVSTSVELGKNNIKLKIVPGHYKTAVSTNTVQLITGSTTVSLGKGKATGKSAPINFISPFLSSDVLVVANVNYSGDPGVDATCWVTDITASGCAIRVRRFDAADKNNTTNITINYLAIGKSKSIANT